MLHHLKMILFNSSKVYSSQSFKFSLNRYTMSYNCSLIIFLGSGLKNLCKAGFLKLVLGGHALINKIPLSKVS